MKSKIQKTEELAESRGLLEKAKSLVFVNFSKTPVSKINQLKNSLREAGGSYKVMKKRLFRILFQEKAIPVDMEQFESQLAVVFSEKDIADVTGVVYRFAKTQEKEGSEFVIVGGADIPLSLAYGADDMKRIGMLPSRDILLAQLAGILNAPVKKLAYVLSEIGKNK